MTQRRMALKQWKDIPLEERRRRTEKARLTRILKRDAELLKTIDPRIIKLHGREAVLKRIKDARRKRGVKSPPSLN